MRAEPLFVERELEWKHVIELAVPAIVALHVTSPRAFDTETPVHVLWTGVWMCDGGRVRARPRGSSSTRRRDLSSPTGTRAMDGHG